MYGVMMRPGQDGRLLQLIIGTKPIALSGQGKQPKSKFFFLQWHALDRAEHAKYYEMARKEKELHMQLYPGWSARDNYASHTKKKRKKKDGTPNKGIVQTPSILIKYFFLLKAMHI